MDNITLVFFVAIAVAFALYMQIQKLTQNIDANETLSKQDDKSLPLDNNTKYKAFCDAIDEQIRWLRNLSDDELVEGKKDEFLQNLSEISKKLTFIQTMNNSSNSQKWEAELFELLNRIEEAVNFGLKDADTINDKLRDELQKEFVKL